MSISTGLMILRRRPNQAMVALPRNSPSQLNELHWCGMRNLFLLLIPVFLPRFRFRLRRHRQRLPHRSLPPHRWQLRRHCTFGRREASLAAARRNDPGALQKVQDETWQSTLGWTNRPDGKTLTFTDCEAGRIRFDEKAGERIAFDATDVTFRGRDVDLAGRLVLRPTQRPGSDRSSLCTERRETLRWSTTHFSGCSRPKGRRRSVCMTSAARGSSGGKYTQISTRLPTTQWPPCAKRAGSQGAARGALDIRAAESSWVGSARRRRARRYISPSSALVSPSV